ncbi:hypothetical protein PWT90_02854 [Aphanocladium album]|nr:hypothetical protein PWT90_02854 [Aphanocladium album]
MSFEGGSPYQECATTRNLDHANAASSYKSDDGMASASDGSNYATTQHYLSREYDDDDDDESSGVASPDSDSPVPAPDGLVDPLADMTPIEQYHYRSACEWLHNREECTSASDPPTVADSCRLLAHVIDNHERLPVQQRDRFLSDSPRVYQDLCRGVLSNGVLLKEVVLRPAGILWDEGFVDIPLDVREAVCRIAECQKQQKQQQQQQQHHHDMEEEKAAQNEEAWKHGVASLVVVMVIWLAFYIVQG